MTVPPFAQALMRKSERALESARIDLRYGDPDGATQCSTLRGRVY